jgi:ribosome-associated protein
MTMSELGNPTMPENGVPVREKPRPPRDVEAAARIHEQALAAAHSASELKGEDIRVLDMRELITYTDFLVISTGKSTRQTRRIAEETGLKLKREHGLLPSHVEGDASGEWILMDYLDFVVHIFTPEAREFYRLDVLWKDAPVERVE